jgi:hypothetical protein
VVSPVLFSTGNNLKPCKKAGGQIEECKEKP